MKILVLVADYPNNNGDVKLMYVHVRNKYYVKNGIDVTVLNFSCNSDYYFDKIPVISLKTYEKYASSDVYQYDILVSHAANIRNHYLFIKKHQLRFSKLMFFFHGHEVLRINKVYSEPYPYVKKSFAKYLLQDLYDRFKLFVWGKYYSKNKNRLYFIFVSQWMRDQFLKWVNIKPSILENRSSITYNCVGSCFENEQYDYLSAKNYDFITIRGSLDGSKYSIDIVNNLAHNNPELKFLVIGKGRFFNYYKKAENITWLDSCLSHEQIIQYLNQSKCVLMPTRTDAQGVMVCEMATFGIPVITSDIPVCHEVFDEFDNVEFISNEDANINLSKVLAKIHSCFRYKKNRKYCIDTTLNQEVAVINGLLDS